MQRAFSGIGTGAVGPPCHFGSSLCLSKRQKLQQSLFEIIIQLTEFLKSHFPTYKSAISIHTIFCILYYTTHVQDRCRQCRFVLSYMVQKQLILSGAGGMQISPSCCAHNPASSSSTTYCWKHALQWLSKAFLVVTGYSWLLFVRAEQADGKVPKTV